MDHDNPKLKLPIPETSEKATYELNCHCDAFRMTLTLSPPLPEYPVRQCNCSICFRSGYLLVYPFRKNVKITQGEDVLKDYSFATLRNKHKFCQNCGSSVYFDPQIPDPEMDILGVNVSSRIKFRCII